MLEDKTPQRTSLSQLGEFGLIEHLTKNFDVKQSSTLKSIGDDAAVLDFKDKKAIVSTDLLIALSPELAMMPFDDSRKNMAQNYVMERSAQLGRVNHVEPYSVIGNPKDVHSGAPYFFLRLAGLMGYRGLDFLVTYLRWRYQRTIYFLSGEG
jgi:hypothetical protein